MKRNKKGQFIKGSKPMVPFKKGQGYWTGKKLSEDHKEKIKEGGKGRVAWNKGIKKPLPRCLECGKELSKHINKFCKSCCKIGEKSHFWVDGRTKEKEPYSVDWTETLRRAIRERDHYICQVCSEYGSSVHHIDYDKQNDDPANLITLCKKCHGKTNFNRNYWLNYFYEKQGIA